MQPNQSCSTRTLHALLSLGRQRLGEPVADLVVGDDVVVQVDPPLCPRDGREPVVVGVRAVLQQRDAVAVAQRRVADPTQDPFQTGAARGGIFRYVEVLVPELSILCQGVSSLCSGVLLQPIGGDDGGAFSCGSLRLPLSPMLAHRARLRGCALRREWSVNFGCRLHARPSGRVRLPVAFRRTFVPETRPAPSAGGTLLAPAIGPPHGSMKPSGWERIPEPRPRWSCSLRKIRAARRVLASPGTGKRTSRRNPDKLRPSDPVPRG